jgi:hypothetical protein
MRDERRRFIVTRAFYGLGPSEQRRQNTSLKNLCLGIEPVIERVPLSSAALFVQLVGAELDPALHKLVQEELEFCPSPILAGVRHRGSFYARCIRALPAFGGTQKASDGPGALL